MPTYLANPIKLLADIRDSEDTNINVTAEQRKKDGEECVNGNQVSRAASDTTPTRVEAHPSWNEEHDLNTSNGTVLPHFDDSFLPEDHSIRPHGTTIPVRCADQSQGAVTAASPRLISHSEQPKTPPASPKSFEYRNTPSSNTTKDPDSSKRNSTKSVATSSTPDSASVDTAFTTDDEEQGGSFTRTLSLDDIEGWSEVNDPEDHLSDA
ncbi:hypothetical protein NQ176_g254 [Zarea fungicola]|uniref:Uncharacterized protein n=1 Tax=Zarea fungicola TaxID=93591 RepID=A0ACC1NZW8_9HYPO|nr:hypothetical protein NQ176_g254 [Lecanicillium fungicola]